jgi:uncharacterized protein YbaR (Trm112 family)
MKPWLLNILACPVDKHHPLEAHILRWKTTQTKIKKIYMEVGEPSQKETHDITQLKNQIRDGTISPSALKSIYDKTGIDEAIKFQKEIEEIAVRIEKLKQEEKYSTNDLFKEIDLLYRYLYLMVVDEGLLVCPKCMRWYPIGRSVEGIPELLPDGLREMEKEKELEWLKKWMNLVPEKVLKDGKPFKPRVKG